MLTFGVAFLMFGGCKSLRSGLYFISSEVVNPYV